MGTLMKPHVLLHTGQHIQNLEDVTCVFPLSFYPHFRVSTYYNAGPSEQEGVEGAESSPFELLCNRAPFKRSVQNSQDISISSRTTDAKSRSLQKIVPVIRQRRPKKFLCKPPCGYTRRYKFPPTSIYLNLPTAL